MIVLIKVGYSILGLSSGMIGLSTLLVLVAGMLNSTPFKDIWECLVITIVGLFLCGFSAAKLEHMK